MMDNVLKMSSIKYSGLLASLAFKILQEKYTSPPIVIQVMGIAKYTISFNFLQMQSAG